MSVQTDSYQAPVLPNSAPEFDGDTFDALPAFPAKQNKPKRRFSHDSHNTHNYGLPTAPICRYFNLNRCFAGPNCRFTHIVNHGAYIIMYPTIATNQLMNPVGQSPMSPMSPLSPPMYQTYENTSNPEEPTEVLKDENGKELCRYYRQGKCFMGVKCRFAHF